MGGYGSTRWAWHTKKNTVEDCRMLSVFELKREGVLEMGIREFGSWIWSNVFTGKRSASISFELNTLDGHSYFRVFYTITSWDGEKQDFDYQIRLQTTQCNFGGYRWWFTCPLSVNGRYCGRRVGKLYLPPSGRYYGCRHCYNLTYKSSQESDKRVNALKKLGPLSIFNGIKSGEVDLLMGLKALPDWVWQRDYSGFER